ncbi:MAG TPA: hypothetical protein VJ911_08195 [Cryomorphaceae bacterium]|nr:hypothetical protein [Cryomorphaceae bacterium]
MNKKDFYVTAVKLIGVYLFVYSAYELIGFGTFVVQPWPDYQFAYSIFYALYSLFPILLAILVINKAETIVRMLRVVDGDPDGSVYMGKWDSKAIAELAIVLLGSYLILFNIVPFIVACIAYFSDLVSIKYPYNPNPVEVRYTDQYDFISSAVSIFIGYLILTNLRWCVNKVVAQDSEGEEFR